MQHPLRLVLCVFAVPILLVLRRDLRRAKKFSSLLFRNDGEKRRFFAFHAAKSAFVAASWISLVVALCAPQRGVEKVPVERLGSALALVIDISNSMNARDVEIGGRTMSRLEFAASYARETLRKAPKVPASVTLAKGSAALFVPLTEDREQIESLLDGLSTTLLTAPGSNLADGVNVALSSLQSQMQSNSTVLFLTDGEALSGELEKSLENAAKAGAKVALLGVGSPEESEVDAGGGRTAMSALREERLLQAVRNVNSRKHFVSPRAFFANAQDPSSLKKFLAFAFRRYDVENVGRNAIFADYEIRPVSRWRFWLSAAVAFYALALAASALQTPRRKEVLKK